MAAVMPTWAALLKLRAWTLLSESGIVAEPLEGTLFKISDGKYIVCVPYDARMTPLVGEHSITIAVWAETDGAARRAVLQDLTSDVSEDVLPPDEMTLSGRVKYGDIAKVAKTGVFGSALESASYRFSDGQFTDRRITLPAWTFHFRGRRDDPQEKVYAVQHPLRD
jgi:hypothetical protein